jgi:hypothetical protein
VSCGRRIRRRILPEHVGAGGVEDAVELCTGSVIAVNGGLDM